MGATVLAATTWFAVDSSWRNRPEPRDSDVFYQEGVMVAVKTGPDVGTAVAVALLLLGATLTVLACARLSTADDGDGV